MFVRTRHQLTTTFNALFFPTFFSLLLLTFPPFGQRSIPKMSLDYCPRASQPFGEYLVTVVGVPMQSRIALLLRCCGTLFLFRNDPQLLRALCEKWATSMRARSTGDGISTPTTATIPTLLSAIVRPAQQQMSATTAATTEQDRSASVELSTSQQQGSGGGDEEIVTSFLSHLQLCVGAYFRWNWDQNSRVVQANLEYRGYVMSELVPIASRMTEEQLKAQDDDHGCVLVSDHQEAESAAEWHPGPPDGGSGIGDTTQSPALTRRSLSNNAESYSIPATVRFVGSAELLAARKRSPSGVLAVFHAACSLACSFRVTFVQLHFPLKLSKWRPDP